MAAHRLQFDAAQAEAAARLDALSEELRRHSPSVVQTLRAWLPWPTLAAAVAAAARPVSLGRRRPRQDDADGLVLRFAQSPQGSRRIRGHGVRAERTHFYRFMRQVHAELAGIEGRARASRSGRAADRARARK